MKRIMLLYGLAIVILAGCGQQNSANPITTNKLNQSNISVNMQQVRFQGAEDTSTGEEKKRHLDDELAKAGDEQTTEVALRDFYNYASSRDSDKNKIISDDDFKKLAKKELSDKRKPRITPEKLAKKMNKLAKETGAPHVTAKEVEIMQQAVRNQMPNIAANPANTAMSPFEAMVVTYAMVSGDDGNAKPGSRNLNITQKQLDTFTKEILEDKED